jgi:uncharacterized protein DUF397
MAGPDWIAAAWRKSRRSGDSGACVEWARAGDRVGIRDSRHRDGVVLVVDVRSWRAFVEALKSGRL